MNAEQVTEIAANTVVIVAGRLITNAGSLRHFYDDDAIQVGFADGTIRVIDVDDGDEEDARDDT